VLEQQGGFAHAPSAWDSQQTVIPGDLALKRSVKGLAQLIDKTVLDLNKGVHG
jgi:hypothetical protein